ncbi:carboxypeptidase M32 [Halobacterium bonnevillei]|uniref:Metal-dependent carboxypeptidase n=1 Tax=Halobacterium bonnevillei TaxID=2692200 RepID=A0A6B0ST92_9EURY|nr:carboxypeptidase M32 [Halobacterium bonnevillei]MXR22030.1 carboxypeptidase M32 [Halobacterium bonnevillei]
MATNTSDADPAEADAYEALEERTKQLSYLGDARGTLAWDQRVMMPEGGAPARGKQLSALSTVHHDLLTADEVGAWLDELADRDLDDDQRVVVRELRRQYERSDRVPSDLVAELTETQSDAQQIWEDAKADADFSQFAPILEDLRDIQVERAEHIDPDADPYEVMFEDGEPYLPLERVEEIFDTLRAEFVPLIEDLKASDAAFESPFDGEYDDDTQMALCREVVDRLGYDWNRGRLDTAPHPFMVGPQFDARITTRFAADDPLGAVMSTVHEFGHASYQHGLPDDQYGLPLGQSRSSGVHESQSRFWENHVARTEAFWEYATPIVNEHLDADADARDVYEAVNRIYPENKIRVEADELTYHMHIILRADVEKAFVGGDVDVDEIPGRWNDLMEEYLGVRPEDDAEGCLQDIHWTGGFASFQNYTVGSVLAAQLDATMREDLDVDGLVREGEFDPIREWLTEHVHGHGQRYTTDELVEVATGEPLTADYFVAYAREKFGELYDL